MHNVSKTVAGGGHFWLEITMSEGFFQQHVLGLQCHTSGCNVRLEWFVWINGTNETCPASIFGDGVHAKCSLGPNW